MKLSVITLQDAQALLDFELDNQAWFEQFIPPREEGFYTLAGVKQHIREFLLDYRCNEMIPLLIKSEQGAIIGRINITNIDSNKRCAHLGYRIAKSSINQGVAKWAVAEAKKLLREQNLLMLFAYAATNNPASQQVLLGNGFKQVKLVKNYAELNGEPLDCIEFRLRCDEH